MKNIYFFLFIIYLSTYSFAQKPILSEDFTFQIGEKYKNVKNLQSYYFATANSLAIFKKGRNDMTIQRFSLEDMKEDLKKRQLIEDKGDFQTMMQLGVRAVIFYSDKNKAYAQGISITGKAAQKPVLLASDTKDIYYDFGFKGTYGFDAGGRIHKFAFKKSFNGSKLLVLYRIKTPDNEPDQIGISVFDAGLELIWKRKIILPHNSNTLENEDFAIDNDGVFYMTASVFNEESKDKLESSYTTDVYKVEEEGDLVKSNIAIEGKSIDNAVIGLNKSGQVSVSGFYVNNSDKTEASGIFSASINPDGIVNSIIKTDFPPDEIKKLELQRDTRIMEGTQSKKDLTEFESLRVNEVIYKEDGSFVIFGEQRFVESFTTSSSSGSRTTYKYYYKNIVAFKSSSEGKMIWMHILPKDQIGFSGKASMSYHSFFKNGKYYLFYIDHFSNLKKDFEEVPDLYHDGKKEFLYLVSYTIDDTTGDVIKEPILTGRDVRNSRIDQLKVTKAVELLNGELIFEVDDGKKNDLLLKLL